MEGPDGTMKQGPIEASEAAGGPAEHLVSAGEGISGRLGSIDVMVILETSSDDVFIGRMIEADAESIVFEYLVIERTLEHNVNLPGEVRLKAAGADAGTRMFPCLILSDAWTQDRSLFNLPVRRCRLRLLESPPEEGMPLHNVC